jgi:glyoxylase-like metal-dependent hydrolase (beta-lactamase superfamily II)/rhodanese-related sulfurtransferase
MDGAAPGAEITAAELARELESGAALQIVDVRAAERVASGSVDVQAPASFINVRNSELFALPDPAGAGIDRALPVVTVCGHGNSSAAAASFLTGHGYRARSLQGGLAAWMQALVQRELAPPPGFTRLLQFDRIGIKSLGYLLVSGSDALAIDVPRDTAAFEQAAREAGARIVGVADSHVHADYISGGPALAARLGVPYYLHPADGVSPYDETPATVTFQPLMDAAMIVVGAGTVHVQHTPGHTEGSVTLIVAGSCAFTGDFIFIASVGRPDLAGRTAEWSGQLFDSLQRALSSWPDGLRILPAHYASEAERAGDRSVVRSFGEVRSANTGLGVTDRAAFLDWVQASVCAPPEGYQRIKCANLGLLELDEAEVEELESGANLCAVG